MLVQHIFNPLLYFLLGTASLAAAVDVVLQDACPPTEFGGEIIASNIPQPYRGVRCLTNHEGLVQTLVQHHVVYCAKEKTCDCGDYRTFNLIDSGGYTEPTVCNYKKTYNNLDLLCGCCAGYVEVDHVCVPPPTTTISPVYYPVQPKLVFDLPGSTTTKESDLAVVAALIWPYAVGGALGLLLLIFLVVLVTCCCCCMAAAPVAAPLEKEKKEEGVIIRVENDYVSCVGESNPGIVSDYEYVTAKSTRGHEKDFDSIKSVDAKYKTTGQTQNVYSDGPTPSERSPVEGVYAEISGLKDTQGSGNSIVGVYKNGTQEGGNGTYGVYKTGDAGAAMSVYATPDAEIENSANLYEELKDKI